MGADVMANLPPGFVLDAPQQAPVQAAGGLPAGFVLDQPAAVPQQTGTSPSGRASFDVNLGQAQRQEPTGEVTAGNVGRALVRGVPIVGGLADEGEAALRATFGGEGTWSERYGRELDTRRAEDAAFDKANPYLSTGLQIAGGVASTLPLGFTAAGARLLGIVPGAGFLPNFGASIASGTGIGAADAFTRGQGGAQERAADVPRGAGIGFVGGGAGAALGAGIGAAYKGVSNAIASRSPEVVAAGLVNRGLARDAIDNPAIAAYNLGPDAALMDLGPNVSQQAAGIATRPGEGQQVVRNAVKERAEGAGQRIEAQTTKAMGPRQNITAIGEEIAARRAQEAAPLYEAAYRAPFQPTQEVLAALETPAGRSAVAVARRLSANEQVPFQLDVRGLDLVKRALDDMIEPRIRAGKNNEARILSNVRETIVSALDASVPDYAAARQAYASASAIKDALESGVKAFRAETTPEEMSRMLAGMTAGEREAFGEGARAAITRVMGTARSDAAAARKFFATGWNQEKLEVLLGPKLAGDLLRTIGAEDVFATTAQRVTGNSETAARQAANAEAQGGGIGMRGSFEAGGVMGAVRAAGLKMFDTAINAVRTGRQADIDKAMADLLTARGIDRRAAIARLRAEATRRDRSGVLARYIRDQSNVLLRGGTVTPAQERLSTR